MGWLTFLAIILLICGRFEISECSKNIESDRRFKEEVDDFADYLKQKLEKHPVSNNNFDATFSAKASKNEDDVDYVDDHHENIRKQSDTDFESFLEDLSQNNPKDSDNLRNSDRHLSRKKLPSSRRKSQSDAFPRHHHGVKEVVYIRKSDSDSKDPIPEMIEKIVNDQPAGRSARDAQESSPDDETEDDPNAISPSHKTCSVKNIFSDLDRTCSDGPEYEIEHHPMLSEALRHQMLAMLLKTSQGGSKCDIKKPLGPETGVEDRALCPFVLNLTNHHSSRLPEHMYEANCACTIPNLPRSEVKGIRCVQVKRAIPVLWLVSCEGGKKRYRQGWDEIAVACAPLDEHVSNAIDPLLSAS